MRTLTRLVLLLLVLLPARLAGQATPEGEYPGLETGKMWTFDNPPKEYWAKRYQFSPSDDWMNHVQLSALRYGNGCTASFVSGNGLVMSNHHCARACIEASTKTGEDFLSNGFYAAKMEESQSAKPRGRSDLHVVMVIQRFRPYFSGQGVQLEELARALVRRGARVTVIAAVRGEDAPNVEHRDGVSIHRLRCDLFGRANSAWSRRLWSPTFALRAFFHLLGSGARPDLIHVHGANDALHAAWALGRLFGVPALFERSHALSTRTVDRYFW